MFFFFFFFCRLTQSYCSPAHHKRPREMHEPQAGSEARSRHPSPPGAVRPEPRLAAGSSSVRLETHSKVSAKAVLDKELDHVTRREKLVAHRQLTGVPRGAIRLCCVLFTGSVALYYDALVNFINVADVENCAPTTTSAAPRAGR